MKTDDQRVKKSVKIKIGLLRRKKRIFVKMTDTVDL
jgi:hypothetical protein